MMLINQVTTICWSVYISPIGPLIIILSLARFKQIKLLYEIELTAWIKASGDFKKFKEYLRAYSVDSNTKFSKTIKNILSLGGTVGFHQPRPISFWDDEYLSPVGLLLFRVIFWPISIFDYIGSFLFSKISGYIESSFFSSKQKVLSDLKLEILTSPNPEVRSLLPKETQPL